MAHTYLTPSIRADLINLKGFKFDRSGKITLPEERLKYLDKLVNKQIDGVLNYKAIYFKKNNGFTNPKQLDDNVKVEHKTKKTRIKILK